MKPQGKLDETTGKNDAMPRQTENEDVRFSYGGWSGICLDCYHACVTSSAPGVARSPRTRRDINHFHTNVGSACQATSISASSGASKLIENNQGIGLQRLTLNGSNRRVVAASSIKQIY
eukprot:scaffold264009_cov27-Tisochrysis_lutea.AAC.1